MAITNIAWPPIVYNAAVWGDMICLVGTYIPFFSTFIIYQYPHSVNFILN